MISDFVQRRIEEIVTEILNDEETPNEKKVDTLVKFHSALVRAKKSKRLIRHICDRQLVPRTVVGPSPAADCQLTKLLTKIFTHLKIIVNPAEK